MDQTRPSSCLLRNVPGRARHLLRPPVSRAELERAIARGRRLQGEAVRSGFRKGFAEAVTLLCAGTRLRGLRYPAARRQPCC